MNENLECSDEEKNLENEFLKIKLKLQHGGEYHTMDNDPGVPVEIENQFLNNIMEFEKQYAERKEIKIFDRIERPGHFKPVNEIPADEIEDAWDILNGYLQKYGIQLSACSPNVSVRELYRFTTEELFDHEIDDMNIPGMMTCFIYDEFYPDHKYDNTRLAEDYINSIFSKHPVEWMRRLSDNNLRINEHDSLSKENFKEIINRWKEAYEDIKVNEIKDVNCAIDEKFCQVKGGYDITLRLPLEEIVLKGNWQVEFELDKEFEYWEVVGVQIPDVRY